MFFHLLESSQRDDSNKCSNIGFGEEITQLLCNVGVDIVLSINNGHGNWGQVFSGERFRAVMCS